jgi:hypothetical protein
LDVVDQPEAKIIIQVLALLESEPEHGEFTKDKRKHLLSDDNPLTTWTKDGCLEAYDIIDSQAAEIGKLREALKEYGTHGRRSDTTMCERDKHGDYPCTCGFEQALKGKQ